MSLVSFVLGSISILVNPVVLFNVWPKEDLAYYVMIATLATSVSGFITGIIQLRKNKKEPKLDWKAAVGTITSTITLLFSVGCAVIEFSLWIISCT